MKWGISMIVLEVFGKSNATKVVDMVKGIKKIANAMLRDKDRYSYVQRKAICELVDMAIAQHQNPIIEGFHYLDLVESPRCIKTWGQAGKPSITLRNADLYVADLYYREYY